MRLKNRLIFFITKLLSLLVSKATGEKERILVISTTALGDTLWATAALESLRLSFPKAFVGLLTSPLGKEVLENNPHIDKIFFFKEPLLPRFFSLWRTLKKENFDTILLFHASQRLMLPLACLLGARRIVGTVGHQKGLDLLFTHPLENLYQHEIERRLKIVEAIGGKRYSSELSIFLEPREKKDPFLPKGRWVALHPGSKDRFKRWPLENFIALGKKLQEKAGCQLLLTGTKEEEEILQQLHKALPESRLLPQGLPIRRLIKLLDEVDLLISNDTGPFHIACALDKPALGIYASTDPALCGPYHAKKAFALSKKPSCSPCLKRGCRRPFCFLQIGVDEVYEKAAHLLLHKAEKSYH